MSRLFDDIKNKTDLIVQSQSKAEAETEVVRSHPKGSRGRPKKSETILTAKAKDVGKSDKVTYLSTDTKTLLQKVKAAMLISTGQSLGESAIVAMALDCFIKNNNLKIS